MADDKLSAALEEIRAAVRARDELLKRMPVSVGEFNAAQDRLAEHAPGLLAVVDAVLKLADDWSAEGPGVGRRPRATAGCGRRLRKAITSALLEEAKTDA